ncbi:MAG: hypothetical protein R2880_11085 [Deinococcales bacterium]
MDSSALKDRNFPKNLAKGQMTHLAQFCLALVLGVIMGFMPSYAQGLEHLELSTLKNSDRISSGSLLTVQLVLENRNSLVMDLRPDFHLPQGWQLLSLPSLIKLAAGEREVVSIPIIIPSTAAAGHYELIFSYRSQSEEKSVISSVEVLSNEALSLRLISSPRLSSQDFKVLFRLSNQGNQRRDLLLRLSDNSAQATHKNQGLKLSLEPERLELAPGESVDVVVSVSLANLERSLTQHLHLELLDPKLAEDDAKRLLAVAQKQHQTDTLWLSEAEAYYIFL